MADVFLVAGGMFLLWKGTQLTKKEETPVNPHAVGRLLDRSYTSLGVNNLNHPEANKISHHTKFSEEYLSKYAQRRRNLRRQTPSKLSFQYTKRNLRSTPARGQFLHDAVTVNAYAPPFYGDIGKTAIDTSINVPYAKILV